MKIALLALSVTIAVSASVALSTEPAKLKTLSSAEAARWIDAVKSRKTADGNTIADTLRFAEKMRPRQFKVGNIDIGYNGASGKPDYVSIEYWIGYKRKPGDALIDLGYDVKTEGQEIVLTPRDHDDFSTVTALESGRDKFIENIDRSYKEFCIDPVSQKKSC